MYAHGMLVGIYKRIEGGRGKGERGGGGREGERENSTADLHCPLQAESQESESASPEIFTQSIRQAVEYNAKLAEQRRTIRQIYLDTQTKVRFTLTFNFELSPISRGATVVILCYNCDVFL